MKAETMLTGVSRAVYLQLYLLLTILVVQVEHLIRCVCVLTITCERRDL